MEHSNQIVNIQIQSFVPLMTQKKYAELVGLTTEAVKAQVFNGHLPTIKSGKYRMINLVALVNTCSEVQS